VAEVDVREFFGPDGRRAVRKLAMSVSAGGLLITMLLGRMSRQASCQ